MCGKVWSGIAWWIPHTTAEHHAPSWPYSVAYDWERNDIHAQPKGGAVAGVRAESRVRHKRGSPQAFLQRAGEDKCVHRGVDLIVRQFGRGLAAVSKSCERRALAYQSVRCAWPPVNISALVRLDEASPGRDGEVFLNNYQKIKRIPAELIWHQIPCVEYPLVL